MFEARIGFFPPLVATALLGIGACAAQDSTGASTPGGSSTDGVDPALVLASRGGSTHPAAGTMANLGRGFDSLQGEVLGDCVVNTETMSFAGGTEHGGATSELVVRYARTREELANALGVSVEASATFGFWSASARAKYAQSESITSDTSFLVISNEIVNDTQSLKTYQLSEAAENALETGGASAFYQMCGDQFVAARVTGGSLQVIVEIKNATSGFSEQLTAGGSVQAWLFSAGGEIQTEALRTLEKQDTRVQVFQAGGLERPGDLRSLVSFAFQFRSHVTGQNSKFAAPISFITAPYSIVATSKPISIPSLTQQRRKLNELAEWHGEAKTLRTDLIKAQAKTAGCNDKGGRIDDAISEIKRFMEAIEVEAQTCVDDPMRGCGNGRARPLTAGRYSGVIEECARARKKDALAADKKAEQRKREELEAQLREARKGDEDGSPCAVWEVRSIKPKLGNGAAWISVTATADAGGSMQANVKQDLFEGSGWAPTSELRVPTRAKLLMEGKVKFETGCGIFDGPCRRGDKVVASHHIVLEPTIRAGTLESNQFTARFECVEASTGGTGRRRASPARDVRQPERRIAPRVPPRPTPRP